MSYVMMDIEADGPIPGDYSMICFGAVIVEPSLSQTPELQAPAENPAHAPSGGRQGESRGKPRQAPPEQEKVLCVKTL